jgi:hypothetical protein
MEAQANRTSRRLREILQEDNTNDDEHVGGRSDDTINGVRIFTGQPLRSAMFDSSPVEAIPVEEAAATLVPPTAVRRNVTQRRSRDKGRDEGDRAPSAALLSRRPRSRSKDRRCSMESTGARHDCERQDWRATRALVQPSQTSSNTYRIASYQNSDPRFSSKGSHEEESSLVTSQSKARGDHAQPDDHQGFFPAKGNKGSPGSGKMSVPLFDRTKPFLRDYIPSESENPELHRSLTQKWYERQDVVRGLGDALAHDDSKRYDVLLGSITQLNGAM